MARKGILDTVDTIDSSLIFDGLNPGIKRTSEVKTTSGLIEPNFDKAAERTSLIPTTSGVVTADEAQPTDKGLTAKGTTENPLVVSEEYRKSKFALESAKFFLDVFNADRKYNAAVGQAQLNGIQIRNQISDTLYRGRQSALNAQLEGKQAGEQASLAAAAQGQDIAGAGVQKVVGSQEAMGLYNSMREEMNAIREAYGLELEQISQDYQVAQADIERQSSMISSGLNLASGFASYKYGKYDSNL